MWDVRQMITIGPRLTPHIETAIRAQDEEEALLLKKNGRKVFFNEKELAKGMARHILAWFGLASLA